eukprot:1682100-Heterocapsa_arctica.AAC.1
MRRCAPDPVARSPYSYLVLGPGVPACVPGGGRSSSGWAVRLIHVLDALSSCPGLGSSGSLFGFPWMYTRDQQHSCRSPLYLFPLCRCPMD